MGNRAVAAAVATSCRLHPGADGFRRHPVHPPRPGLRVVPAAARLRRAGNRTRRHAAHAQARQAAARTQRARSEEHTSELQSLMRISYAVFCLKKKNKNYSNKLHTTYKCKN